MNDEMDEIRRRTAEEHKMKERMAYEGMVRNGEAYLREFGEAQVQRDVELFRVDIQVWNKLTKSTVPFTLQTIDAMLQIYSTMPGIIGMDVIQRPAYLHHIRRLSAARNYLIKMRDEAVKLSTNKLDNDTKQA